MIVLISVVAVLVILGLMIAGMYNGLVAKDTAVEGKWGNVQASYQRRADLIPNLVDTVKGYKDYEQATLTKITELRSSAASAQANMKAAKNVNDINAASGEMDSILSRLLVIVEAYPDLKASQNFLALQDELAGTENRITYARTEYNDAVKAYKTGVRTFPRNIIAGMFGFSVDKWEMFQADEGAEKAPKVVI